MTTLNERLIDLAQQVVAAMSGTATVSNYYVGFLDNFDVNASALTSDHENTLDQWIAGDGYGFPYRAGSSSQRIVSVVGLASQTGPEANNQQLGRDRAQAVYDYLASRIPAGDLVNNVASLGSSKPRPGYDSPGSEFGENRAVAIVLEVQFQQIGVVHTPPPPPQDPAEPASKQWEILIRGSIEAGTPGVEVIGGQVIEGNLKNIRTGEDREFVIVIGGISAAIELAPPITLGVNLTPEPFPFTTHWVDWEDFDFSGVVFLSAEATNVVSVGPSALGLQGVNAVVEPENLFIKTVAVGVGVQFQMGVMILL